MTFSGHTHGLPSDRDVVSDATRDGTHPIAQEARQVLLRHYTDPNTCSTTRLAEALGVTASHLCHVYKRAWGATIGADLRRLRIDLAKRVLADRSIPIKQVAAQVGYERATYRAFFNAFRAETGMPPSRYRKLLLRSIREEERQNVERQGPLLDAATRRMA